MKLRLAFEKTGEMKYIGHLDLLRFFQKVFRRSGVDMRYSEGYSPHMLLSFAMPLSVGMESVGEILDLEVNSLPGEELCLLLNRNSVQGIRIREAVKLPDNAKNAMSLVSAADYRIRRKSGQEEPWQDLIRTFFDEAEELLVTKKTKKSETVLNMKDLVYSFCEDRGELALRISSGSEKNVKPELFLTAFFERAGISYLPAEWRILRESLLTGNREKGFVSLLSLGEPL